MRARERDATLHVDIFVFIYFARGACAVPRNYRRGFRATCHDERNTNYKMCRDHFTTCGYCRSETARAPKLRHDSSKVGFRARGERRCAKEMKERKKETERKRKQEGQSHVVPLPPKWMIKITAGIIGLPLERQRSSLFLLIETLTVHTQCGSCSALFMQNAIRANAHSTTRGNKKNQMRKGTIYIPSRVECIENARARS